MPTINEMRQAVLDAFPNASMSFRERMATTKNTRQIVAIYKKLNKEKPKEPEGYHQMDIFEFAKSVIIVYGIFMGIILVITYIVSLYQYNRALQSTKLYYANLKKLSQDYGEEE